MSFEEVVAKFTHLGVDVIVVYDDDDEDYPDKNWHARLAVVDDKAQVHSFTKSFDSLPDLMDGLVGVLPVFEEAYNKSMMSSSDGFAA